MTIINLKLKLVNLNKKIKMSVILNKNLQNIDENLTKEIHEINHSGITHNSKFLIQLYEILEDENNKNIIHWGEDGQYFIIENMYDFIEKILPKYYNHNNYASFVRQLNKYNFHKIKTSINENAFQNNQFIKGKKDLISNILRKKKRKRDFETGVENVTSLVKYKKNNYLDDLNNLGKNLENKNNFSFERHSLSLDEDNENINNNTNKIFNTDNPNNNFIRYNSNSTFIPFISKQINPLILKQNLSNESIENKNNKHKKISKKAVDDLLNEIINKSDKISKKQKTLNVKIDSLSSKNKEYIDNNNIILKEIESKNDNNKILDQFISFILDVKNINKMKNRLLPENINNIQKNESNDSSLNNIEIINSADHLEEGNKSVNSKEFINKKVSENEYGTFQSFYNKYFESKKNKGLLLSSENNHKNNNNFKLEQKNSNSNIFVSKNSNAFNADTISKMNDTFSKDKFSFERGNSNDNFSSIFKRNRSNSFHSSLSNNISDNLSNNDNILFGNSNQNDYNINNRSEIIWNNNIDSNNINNNLNKSFDADYSQGKNSRKDSLNNSSYSFIDLPSKI